MFCTNCGKEIPDEANFCRYCGSPVTFRKPVAEVKQPVEIKEEIHREEVSVPKAEIHEELAEAEKEMDMAMEIGEMIETSSEEPTCEAKEEKTPEVCPAAVYKEPEIPAEQQKTKKKISPMIWIIAGVGVLLIIAVIIIITLLGKIREEKDNDIPQGNNGYPNEYISEDEEENEYGYEAEAEDEYGTYSDFPELSHDYDDFLNSSSFNHDAVLNSGEILYMGEAYYNGIGQCHVTFVLTSDRKSLRNFTIYLNDISLELTQNGATYDLSGVSIRQEFNNTIEYNAIEYSDDLTDLTIGGNTLNHFSIDSGFLFAYGVLDYSFSYYPPSIGGTSSSPIETHLGSSDVFFYPVMIG